MNKLLRLLIVEDSENDALLVVLKLKQAGYDVSFERVQTEAAMDAALSKEKWDIIISDYVMPNFSGPAALRLLQRKVIDLPFIIVSGKIGEDIAVEAVKAGAYDYLMKNNLKRLVVSVEQGMREAENRREHKKSEDALKNSEANFRAIFDHANDGILLADAMGKNFHIGNNAICQMLGYSLEEIKNLSVADIHPKEDLPYVMGQFERQIRKEIKVSKDLPMKRKDGSVFYADVNSSLVTLAGRTYLLGIFRDITERKLAEEALRNAAQEWRTTFDSIVDMVSIHDKNYKIIRVNKSFADRFKMKTQEIVGKVCYELVHRTNEPPPGCPHRGTLETKIPQRCEYFESHLGIYLEVSTSPIFDAKGDAVGSVHIARDISYRKKLEKLQRLTELGKLVADMAHEVNNPLMIISGNAQLSLLDGTLNEEVKNNLKIIHEECNRAKDIIQRLLKFSRPTKGERKETDINQCIESVTKLIEHQFSLSDVKIQKDLKHDLPAIVIDEKQIQEVFMNLLNNAREAMPNGGTIDISTSLKQDFLRIDIKDSGMGMDEETLSRLFEPFFTTKEKGTGLGLAVCHGIVMAHNGELKFESQPGKGTIARVLLPIRGG